MKGREWTDSLTGVTHRFDGPLCSWHCSIHDRVCNPFRRVTAEQLLDLAARDEFLDDDAFPLVARALRGEEPIGDAATYVERAHTEAAVRGARKLLNHDTGPGAA